MGETDRLRHYAGMINLQEVHSAPSVIDALVFFAVTLMVALFVGSLLRPLLSGQTTGTIGPQWGSFVKQAAASNGPAGAPTARLYNKDGEGYMYRVSFDNETGTIELYSDRDSGIALAGDTRDPNYATPSGLRK